jgi:hypothetical protein
MKAFLKKMLATYIPREMVYRSKSGFGLDIQYVFRQSSIVRTDLDRALSYLDERKIISEKLSPDALIRRYPHYAFSLIALYRSILNNERS